MTRVMYYDPARAVVTFRGHNLTERTNMTDQKEPKPTQEWGFTAKPDFARICREVAATGADVARVSSRGSNPVTLVRSDSPAGATRIRKRLFGSYVTGAPDWLVLAGDHVAALTEPKPEPVKVEAFGGRKLGAVAIDLETAQTKPGAVAPPPVAPVTVKVRTHAGAGSVVEYIWGDQLRKPELGWNAFLATDGKVYGSSDFGRRRAVGIIVSGETWGVFDWLGLTYPTKAAAEDQIQRIPEPQCTTCRYRAERLP